MAPKEKHGVRQQPGDVFRRRETRHVKYAPIFLARHQFMKENVLGVEPCGSHRLGRGSACSICVLSDISLCVLSYYVRHITPKPASRLPTLMLAYSSHRSSSQTLSRAAGGRCSSGFTPHRRSRGQARWSPSVADSLWRRMHKVYPSGPSTVSGVLCCVSTDHSRLASGTCWQSRWMWQRTELRHGWQPNPPDRGSVPSHPTCLLSNPWVLVDRSVEPQDKTVTRSLARGSRAVRVRSLPLVSCSEIRHSFPISPD